MEAQKLLEEKGMETNPLQFTWLTNFLSVCGDLPTGCFFQNGANPYGVVKGDYILSNSNAIVLISCTPPEVEYYGFTGYFVTRSDPPSFPFSSVGDTANQETIQTFQSNGEKSSQKFQSNFIVILSANKKTTDKITSSLQRQFSIGSKTVNVLPIPASPTAGVNVTINKLNTFTIIGRTALPKNEQDLMNYLNSNTQIQGFQVEYKERVSVPPEDLFGYPNLRSRALNVNENEFLPNLRVLNNAIQSNFANLENFALLEKVNFAPAIAQIYTKTYKQPIPPPYAANFESWQAPTCNAFSKISCFADNRDTLYTSSLTTFTLTNNTIIVVVGVNHNATNIVRYSNVQFVDMNDKKALVSVTNTEFTNGNNFLPVSLQSSVYDKLFVQIFARNCKVVLKSIPEYIPSCIDISESSFPSSNFGNILQRAYMTKNNVGPLPEAILLGNLLVYQNSKN